MTRKELFVKANTGDKLFVKGNAFVRVATGETYSHVAVIVKYASRLCVYEFVESIGFQVMSLDAWLDARKGETLFFGQSPISSSLARLKGILFCRKFELRDKDRLPRYRRIFSKNGYGYVSLLKIWVAQITGWNIPVKQLVCSTFAQQFDEASGYTPYTATADPGNIAETCIVEKLELVE